MRLPSLRHLSYLVAVVDAGHFGRAAEACHVTQPTLSAGIKQLEALLGATLIERGHARALPTEAGEAVLPLARTLLRQAEDLRVTAESHAGPPHGLLDALKRLFDLKE